MRFSRRFNLGVFLQKIRVGFLWPFLSDFFAKYSPSFRDSKYPRRFLPEFLQVLLPGIFQGFSHCFQGFLLDFIWGFFLTSFRDFSKKSSQEPPCKSSHDFSQFYLEFLTGCRQEILMESFQEFLLGHFYWNSVCDIRSVFRKGYSSWDSIRDSLKDSSRCSQRYSFIKFIK